MAFHVRHPVWITKAAHPGAEAFAILFSFESFARAILASVLPLDALRLMGSPGDVSLVYFLAGSCGVLGGFFVPQMHRWLPRRYIYSAGALALIAAAGLMMLGSIPTQVAGMMLRVLGVVMLTICLNLYVLDHIAKKDLNHSEPKRVFYSAFAWTLAPALGTWIYTRHGPEMAYAAGMGSVVLCLVYFWFLRLSENSPVNAAKQPAPNPLRNIHRYFRQPRLVTAWLVAVGRSSWWSMIFIYTPLFAVETGLGEMAGGLMVSIASGFVFLIPAWGRYLRVYGMRSVLLLGFIGSGLAGLTVAASIGTPYVAAVFLLLGSLLATSMDATGNMPFMLAVRSGERAAMASVYSTYRDVAELAPPGVFSIVLRYFDLSAVFLLTGLGMLGMAGLSRKLHPRLGLRVHSAATPHMRVNLR